MQSWAAIVMGILSGSIPWVTMMILHKKSTLLQKVTLYFLTSPFFFFFHQNIFILYSLFSVISLSLSFFFLSPFSILVTPFTIFIIFILLSLFVFKHSFSPSHPYFYHLRIEYGSNFRFTCARVCEFYLI